MKSIATEIVTFPKLHSVVAFKTQNWSELSCAMIGWNICRRWKFLLYWLSSRLAHAAMLVCYQIVEIRNRINIHFDSMVQGLGGKVMLQYTGLAKKNLDVLRPTQWSALFLNAFKMSWNPAIHCALYTTIEWILLFLQRMNS